MGPLRLGAGRCRGPPAPRLPTPRGVSSRQRSAEGIAPSPGWALLGRGLGRMGAAALGASLHPQRDGDGWTCPGLGLGLASWPSCHRAEPKSPEAPSAGRGSSEPQAWPPAEVPGVNNPGVCKQPGDNRAGRNPLWQAPSRRRPACGVPWRRSVPRRRGAATGEAGAEPPAPGGAGQRGARGGTPTPWQGLGAAGPRAWGRLGLSLPAALLV